MGFPLEDKISIVTGGSRGIGRGIAFRLAAQGSLVVLCARDQQALDSAVAEIQQNGGTAASISLDLRTPDSGARLVQFAIERFERIDILVNNAGATKRGDFLDLADQDFADGFALKYFGAVRITRAAWPHLKASRGSAIFIAGVGGRTPGSQFTIGGSVNAALLSLTKALADLGVRDGVQVNAINPGTVRTARYTARLGASPDPEAAEREYVRNAGITRIGEPADIAALIAFVAGPEGRFLQGALIDVDGGATKTI
jgi:3-oxoacyl-[acyl-carrier protein] reductase